MLRIVCTARYLNLKAFLYPIQLNLCFHLFIRPFTFSVYKRKISYAARKDKETASSKICPFNQVNYIVVNKTEISVFDQAENIKYNTLLLVITIPFQVEILFQNYNILRLRLETVRKCCSSEI